MTNTETDTTADDHKAINRDHVSHETDIEKQKKKSLAAERSQIGRPRAKPTRSYNDSRQYDRNTIIQ